MARAIGGCHLAPKAGSQVASPLHAPDKIFRYNSLIVSGRADHAAAARRREPIAFEQEHSLSVRTPAGA